tara:strand:+ start:3747 stop:4325 length:579 start_codon:yes stop_codon:yes gene_type:complete
MFTGIIEEIAEVVALKKEGKNIHFSLKSNMSSELKVDQSLAHNGVCLTVIEIQDNIYKVTAVNETLQKTNLCFWQVGSKINIERSIKLGGRIDGHIVQGHVDQTAVCTSIEEDKGSYVFTFKYQKSNNITVSKGSICINGVSLTIVSSKENSFSVAIIPYTFANTNFHEVKLDSVVNIEFDILGKYIQKIVK